jgi:predicted cobalt transporter CbtA
VPVADIYARQLWWVAAVLCTAVALWLLLDRSKSVPVRLIGLLLVILPYAIGAPVAKGESAVPASLIHQFATASILTTGMFWIALGSIGGLLSERFGSGSLSSEAPHQVRNILGTLPQRGKGNRH